MTGARDESSNAAERQIAPAISDKGRRYDAFLSYSHVADGQLAPALRDGLVRFSTPWTPLRWASANRALRVFQDSSSLAANPALWPSIQSALARSDWFILLASPEAARSPWVMKEIDWWQHNKPPGRLLIALTDGEIAWDSTNQDFDWRRSNALPRGLERSFNQEPYWVDLRWARAAAQATLRDPRFQDATADLAAPLRGIPKDELIGEDIRRRRALNRWRNTAIIVVLTLAAAAIWQWQEALDQQKRAIVERDQAFSGELASHALLSIDSNYDRALLLSIEAYATYPTPRAMSVLYRAVSSHPNLRTFLRGHLAMTPPHAKAPRPNAVAAHPNGKLIAALSGHDSGSITLWNMEFEPAVGNSLPLSEHDLIGIAFSPDGKKLAGIDRSGALTVVDLEHTTSRSSATKVQKEGVSGLSFSPDGAHVATSGYDGTIVIWDVESIEPIGPPLAYGGTSNINRVRYTSDGRYIIGDIQASPSHGGALFIWERETLSVRDYVLPTRNGLRSSFSVSPKSNTIAAPDDEDPEILLWDPDSLEVVGSIDTREMYIVSATAFSPDGRYLASGDLRGNIKVWELEDYAPTSTQSFHAGEAIQSLAFLSAGRQLVAYAENDSVTLWNVVSTRSFGSNIEKAERFEWIALGQQSRIRAISFENDQIRVFDSEGATTLLADEFSVKRLKKFGPPVFSVAGFGRRLAVVDESGRAYVYDTITGARTVLRGEPFGEISAISLHPMQDVLAVGDEHGQIGIYDAIRGEIVDRVSPPGEKRIVALQFNSDGKYLAFSEGGELFVWDSEEDRVVAGPLVDTPAELFTLSFDPNDTLLAGGGVETFSIWDLTSMKTVKSFSTGSAMGMYIKIGYSPDGTLLAWNRGYPPDLHIVDAKGREELGPPLLAPGLADSSLSSFGFAPDGKRIIAGYYEGQLVEWDLDPQSWRHRACRVANRNLTREEWEQYFSEHPYRETCSRVDFGDQ